MFFRICSFALLAQSLAYTNVAKTTRVSRQLYSIAVNTNIE